MEYINISAIIIGPIVAVCLSLWLQQRKEKRDAKIKLFLCLMANRKSYPLSYDMVGQLNLIDVIFADTQEVVNLWHDYYAMLSRQNPSPQELQEQAHKYLELLSKMAASLGYEKLQQTHIDKFYIPQAHVSQADINAECQREWLRVLKNSSSFGKMRE